MRRPPPQSLFFCPHYLGAVYKCAVTLLGPIKPQWATSTDELSLQCVVHNATIRRADLWFKKRRWMQSHEQGRLALNNQIYNSSSIETWLLTCLIHLLSLCLTLHQLQQFRTPQCLGDNSNSSPCCFPTPHSPRRHTCTHIPQSIHLLIRLPIKKKQ